VLHPIGRIGSLNRGNLATVRQIESAAQRASPVGTARGTLRGMTKPDPMLAQIAARFTHYGVEKIGGGT
jgi:hypothetical protein